MNSYPSFSLFFSRFLERTLRDQLGRASFSLSLASPLLPSYSTSCFASGLFIYGKDRSISCSTPPSSRRGRAAALVMRGGDEYSKAVVGSRRVQVDLVEC